MVDESASASAGDEIVRFAFRRLFGRRQLQFHYESVRVAFDWPDTDEGRTDLDRVVELMEELMSTAFQEMDVRDQLRDLDKEIEAFFTRDCDETPEDESE